MNALPATPFTAVHSPFWPSNKGEPLFSSFFLGGFESSTHVRRDGKRLDVISATRHDDFAEQDYARLRETGIRAARDAVRWHLIEATPGHYDWSSVLPLVHSAQGAGVKVIWDLCHYGWPDHFDIFSPRFPDEFARFSGAFARLLRQEGEEIPFFTPVNEISFFAWAGGEVGYLNPFACGRGHELKAQLVRATIAAIEAIWAEIPGARICHVDPIINIVADPARPWEQGEAERQRTAQFEAWDMISGRLYPDLGGRPEYLDIVGVNYYVHNQRIFPGGPGTMLEPSHSLYKPLHHMLRDTWERYERPLFIAETGIEEEARPAWLKMVTDEARKTLEAGVPLHGVCLYPILNHPGWDDDRHCHNGLWDYADEWGEREIYEPLAHELCRQQEILEGAAPFWVEERPADDAKHLLDGAARWMEETEKLLSNTDCEMSAAH